MRSRVFSAVTAGALALAIATSFAPAAGARPSAGIKVSHAGNGPAVRVRPTAGALLHNQNDNDSGNGIVSQNFEKVYNIYDSQGADSFKVPAGQTWAIKEVDVTGVYFNGPGPARSERVTFYENNGGLPGAVINSVTRTGTDNGTGSFAISGITGVTLTNGAYWVSVQANMDFGVGGEWGWEGRTVQSGHAAAWQNPGDGFATGCTTYKKMKKCILASQGTDFMFAVRGKRL